jgi:kinesin family protein 2/24
VYKVTVEPIIPTIFQRTKATCFAYGQTGNDFSPLAFITWLTKMLNVMAYIAAGSGKTYTMQPLPLRACQDILNMMQHPSYRNQGHQLWLSFFEIYGGKLYDLLNDRRCAGISLFHNLFLSPPSCLWLVGLC